MWRSCDLVSTSGVDNPADCPAGSDGRLYGLVLFQEGMVSALLLWCHGIILYLGSDDPSHENNFIMHIWFIHGANASPVSFEYLKGALDWSNYTDITYSAKAPIHETVDRLVDMLDNEEDEVHIIGHSMGGILASAIAQRRPLQVETVTTISTPFGGSETANLMSFFMPFDPFLKNIRSSNDVLTKVRREGAAVPTLSIITTACSNPFEPRKNDGVVTVQSQLDFPGAIQIEHELNHFEALLSPAVADQISTHMTYQLKTRRKC